MRTAAGGIPLLAQDRGSAPAAVLAWMGTALAMLGAVGLLGIGAWAQSRAAAGADLAALAAADALTAAAPDPCAVAAETARRNGVQLVSCTIDGDEVVTEATADAGVLGPIRARARAGPGPLPASGGGNGYSNHDGNDADDGSAP